MYEINQIEENGVRFIRINGMGRHFVGRLLDTMETNLFTTEIWKFDDKFMLIFTGALVPKDRREPMIVDTLFEAYSEVLLLGEEIYFLLEEKIILRWDALIDKYT